MLGAPVRFVDQLNRAQDSIDLLPTLRRSHPPDLQAQVQVVPDAQVREKGVALKHHANASSLRRYSVQGAALQFDPAFIRMFQSSDQAKGGALAATARPQQCHTFTGQNLKVQIPQDPAGAITLSECVQLQHQPFTAPLVRPATICR